MRVVVGSEESRDSKQIELERHLEAMARFTEGLRGNSALPHHCTMILRSPASAPAQALIAMQDALLSARVRARVILAKLEPEDDLRQLFASLSALSPNEGEAALIRWARNSRLLDAHEQVTYGTAMCWSGDAMRRDADKRNPLVLLDLDAPDAARRGQLAFKAMWRASADVPVRLLYARRAAKPSGAYERASDAPVTALRPHLQGWPLVRH
ncbi:MAG: hypothetical protein R3D30_06060 [Hyphomicrobiales bacterium]